jgi:hypothetical protein
MSRVELRVDQCGPQFRIPKKTAVVKKSQARDLDHELGSVHFHQVRRRANGYHNLPPRKP